MITGMGKKKKEKGRKMIIKEMSVQTWVMELVLCAEGESKWERNNKSK
jgi:hypothetical protein